MTKSTTDLDTRAPATLVTVSSLLTLALLGSACASGGNRQDDTGSDSDDDAASSDASDGWATDAGTTGDDGGSSGTTGWEPTAGDSDSGDSSGDSGDTDGGDCLADEVQAILVDHCAGCHGPGSAGLGNMDYIDDLWALVNNDKVTPFDAEGSKLYKRLTSADSPMPPEGVDPRPSDAHIELIRQWIDEGAQASCEAQCEPIGEHLDMTWVGQQINADLDSLDDLSQPFTRYLTLVHHANRGLCDEEIEPYRDALRKLVLSLSTEAGVVVPTPVDEHGLIFRVDLRDYDWDKKPAAGWSTAKDAWDLVVELNPFAVEWDDGLFDDIKAKTGNKRPFQPFDAFADIATRSDTYHAILRLPNTQAGLEQQLNIDCVGSNHDDNPVRVGMFKGSSGVSEFDRVIERCEVDGNNQRTYWRSYDFGTDFGLALVDGEEVNVKSIKDEPLDFSPDGGEIIFSLPNGFQGYMIIDGQGNRINEAPVQVVQDQSADNPIVRNPLSCMGCHQSGMNNAIDEVRPYVLENDNNFNDQFDEILEVYLEQASSDMYLQKDREIFQNAMTDAGIATGGANEPIRWTIDRFQDNLDVARAAAEIGVTVDELEGEAIDDLESLESGDISRAAFAAVYQNVICEFNFGLNVKVVGC